MGSSGPLSPPRFAGATALRLGGLPRRGIPPEACRQEIKSRKQELKRRGELLTGVRPDCEVCNTAQGWREFRTAGFAFVLPFGAIYSTNINPRMRHGNRHPAGYSDAKFLDAVHRGSARKQNPTVSGRCPICQHTTCRDGRWRIRYSKGRYLPPFV